VALCEGGCQRNYLAVPQNTGIDRHGAAGGEVVTGGGESAVSTATEGRSPDRKWTRWRLHRGPTPPASGHTAPGFFAGKRSLSRSYDPFWWRPSLAASYQMCGEQRMRENLNLTGPHESLAVPDRRRSRLICMARLVH